MHAIGFDAYGGPNVLRPVVLPDPHPGPGEVRVRVAAAGVAPVDAMERTGRLAALNEGLTPPFVPGMEVAGVIDEVGPGAKRHSRSGRPSSRPSTSEGRGAATATSSCPPWRA